MEWEVEFTDEFERWWNGLSEDEQDSVDQMVRLLQMRGTRKTARRPYSIFTALEHEGVTSPARGQAVSCAICFRSQTLWHLLTGGDKTGNDRWYQELSQSQIGFKGEHLLALEKEKENNG